MSLGVKHFSPSLLKTMFMMMLTSALLKAEEFTIQDDGFLDGIVGFIKANLNGNLAYIIIIVGVTIGSIAILSGKWGVAITAFVGAIFIGSITFWADIAQSMGQSMAG